MQTSDPRDSPMTSMKPMHENVKKLCSSSPRRSLTSKSWPRLPAPPAPGTRTTDLLMTLSALLRRGMNRSRETVY